MESERYFWIDAHGEGRNRYILFRREFDWSGASDATIELFVDTRYRLIVNGRTVLHGPSRFMVGHPCFDTVNLKPYLQKGRNCIGILANSLHCLTFQSERSTGGVYVGGGLGEIEHWRALESPGHDPQAHCLTFAIGPAEALDLRNMPVGWDMPSFNDSHWSPVVAREDPPWGALTPRTIPLLDESLVKPSRQLGSWIAEPVREETLFSTLVTGKGGHGLNTKGFVVFETNLFAPEARTETLATWWGDHYLNGKKVNPHDAPVGKMRREVEVELQKGWNRLVVAQKLGYDFFDFTLGVPPGIEVSAESKAGSPNTFLIGGPWEDQLAETAEKFDWASADLSHLPPELGVATPWARERISPFAFKQHGWRTFHPGLNTHSKPASLSLVFEFPGEILGRPLLSYQAEPGTTVDLFYTERLNPDGSADVHHDSWGLFTADRYITDEAQTPIHSFHPRGFKYLEVFVTGEIDKFEIKELQVTRANYPVHEVGDFSCSDPLLESIWKIGRTAQYACMEDVFLDCPWRERGLYAGDSLVQFHVNLATFGDHALVVRTIELLLQRPPPADGGNDYHAITILALADYWRATGDRATVVRLLPKWQTLVEALLPNEQNGQILVDGTHLDPYIDSCYVDKSGVNCSLNCFLYGALEASVELFDLCGRHDEAKTSRLKARQLGQAIREGFWDEVGGVFTDRTKADHPTTGPSVPSNTLPLFFQIASPDQTSRALDWIEQTLRSNHRDQHGLNVNAYFSYYVLAVFYRHGKVSESEEFIRANWGPMVTAGAWATWEYFNDTNSRCHAWSAAPTHYLSTQVLGIRQSHPGDPNRFEIRPNPGTLTWARGDYPHPHGIIHVEWKWVNGKVDVKFIAPPGVLVTL